jgi:hypothetical protein
MQSTIINSVLKDILNVDRRVLNEELCKIDTYKDVGYTNDHYFFLKRELGVRASGWNDAKKNGMIRHAKIHKDKFYDYVVDKTFDTIEDWVKDAGGKMEDVLYGENRVRNAGRYDYLARKFVGHPYTPKYVELKDLLKVLGYEEPPQVDVPAEVVAPDVTELLSLEMTMRGLAIDHVYVLNGGAIVPWKTFVGQ